MNTKIYKQVLVHTDNLLAAVQQKNQKRFDGYYAELKQLCETHQGTDKDHPVQWETLADFTDDLDEAVTVYEHALVVAEEVNDKDCRSSIGYSIASLKVELGDEIGAIEHLEKAKISCNKIIDKELKAEIHDLLEALKTKHGVVEEDVQEEVKEEVKEEAKEEAQPSTKKKLMTFSDLI